MKLNIKLLNILVMTGLVLIGIISRLVEHEPNFTAVGALALLSGFLFDFKHGYLIPIAILLISDMFIGFYLWPVMLSIYGSFILVYMIGQTIKRKKSFIFLVGGSLVGSVLFYLLTNWAVWSFGMLYPHTIAGLIESYYLALPFFRNTLMGDIFYLGIFYFVFEVVKLTIHTRVAVKV